MKALGAMIRKEFVHIRRSIGVVVAIELCGRWLDTCCSQLFNEFLRAADSAKDDWAIGRIGHLNRTPKSPNGWTRNS